jgi:hypothetical protein
MDERLLGPLFGFFLGVLASVLVTQFWEFRTRYGTHKAARKLVGEWTAYNLEGRGLSQKPMERAGPTVVSLKSCCLSANAGILDFESYDIDDTGKRRPHSGCIMMDPRVPWMATRTDRYEDSRKVVQQRLVIGRDPSVVYVFPIPTESTLGNVYSPHAWCKTGDSLERTTPISPSS